MPPAAMRRGQACSGAHNLAMAARLVSSGALPHSTRRAASPGCDGRPTGVRTPCADRLPMLGTGQRALKTKRGQTVCTPPSMVFAELFRDLRRDPRAVFHRRIGDHRADGCKAGKLALGCFATFFSRSAEAQRPDSAACGQPRYDRQVCHAGRMSQYDVSLPRR